jgi:hypothetical protein
LEHKEKTMTNEQQMATFIGTVMNMAMVPSNDVFQQNLLAAKQWVQAIATGALLVTPLPPPPSVPTPAAVPKVEG